MAVGKLKPAKRTRDQIVRFIAGRAEVSAWRKLAVARDRTLSAWIRDLCNAETSKQVDREQREAAR